MDAGAAPAPLVGPLRHRPGPPALHHPPTAPTRPTGSAHVSNSSCYSTCSGFHLLKISSIVTSASFYLAFTDQWCCCVNLCRCVELGGGFPVKKKVQRSVGHFSAGKVVAHVLEAKMLAFVAADSLCIYQDGIFRSLCVVGASSFTGKLLILGSDCVLM